MLGKPDVELICTLKIIKKMRKEGILAMPEVVTNQLDDLISYFYFSEYRELTTGYHDALTDCYKVALLLKVIIENLYAEDYSDLVNYGEK